MVTKKYHIKWVSVLKLDLYSEKKVAAVLFFRIFVQDTNLHRKRLTNKKTGTKIFFMPLYKENYFT